jgi:hypothetical protein
VTTIAINDQVTLDDHWESPLVAHDGILRRFPVFHYLGQRGAAVERKIDLMQEIAGLTENFAEPHFYVL